MKHNVRNKLMRGQYASQKMRNAAKLLIAMRKIDPEVETMSGFLTPDHFLTVVAATLQVHGGTDDNFQCPDSAIKSGYDLDEMLDIKERSDNLQERWSNKWRQKTSEN